MNLAALFAGLLLGLGGATPASAEPREPTGKWLLNFGDAQCVAMRDYGSPKEPLHLIIKPSPFGSLIQASIVRSGGGSREPAELPVAIRFDDKPPISNALLSFRAEDQKLRVFRVNMTSGQFAPVRQAKSISITSPGKINESLRLGPMDKLMKQMDACIKSLQADWNIGVAAEARLAKRAEAIKPLNELLDSEDYPFESIIKQDDGTVGFILLIDTDGKVADCMVTQTSNVPFLDAQTCYVIMNRGRFAAATGADGKPARATLVGRVNWVTSWNAGRKKLKEASGR